jgi:hypothetical protein
LRLLELDILRDLYKGRESGFLDISRIVWLDVDRFYGIEIEEFPAQIAQVALWMTDHQMNLRISVEFGSYYHRLPLRPSPNILYGPEKGNALRIDWSTVVDPKDLSFILGNPRSWESSTRVQARKPMAGTYASSQSSNPFAHRTFRWSSEAEKAAVHCVIVGFGLEETGEKTLFDYETRIGTALPDCPADQPLPCGRPDVFLEYRRKPLCPVPEIVFGTCRTMAGTCY